MKKYRNFILVAIVSFIFVTTNPAISDAASSGGSNMFIIYLPLGVIGAAILAGIVNVVEKIIKKN